MTSEKVVTGSIIASNCPECGKHNCFHAEIGQAVKCINCKSIYKTKSLIKVKYICPYCHAYGNLLAEDDAFTINCRSCRAPVDLHYSAKRNELYSLDFSKKCTNKGAKII